MSSMLGSLQPYVNETNTYSKITFEYSKVISPCFDDQLSQFRSTRNIHVLEILVKKVEKLPEVRVFDDVKQLNIL